MKVLGEFEYNIDISWRDKGKIWQFFTRVIGVPAKIRTDDIRIKVTSIIAWDNFLSNCLMTLPELNKFISPIILVDFNNNHKICWKKADEGDSVLINASFVWRKNKRTGEERKEEERWK